MSTESGSGAGAGNPTMAPPLSVVESLAAKIIGPFLIGTLINMFLFGAVYVQTYVYARTCGKDPMWRKVLVAVTFILDILHLVFLCHMLWIYAIERNGDVPEFFTVSFYPFGLGLIFGAMSIGITQVFFSWRVWRVSGNWWIPAIAIFASLGQLALTIACVLFTTNAGTFAQVQKTNVEVAGTLFLIFDLVTDLLNFGALAWYLHKRRGAFQGTNDMLSRLTRGSIQTGAILVVWVTIDLILYHAVTNGTFFVFLMSIPNLYTNCLMSSLNARVTWGDDAGTSSKTSVPVKLPSMFKSNRSQSQTTETEPMDLSASHTRSASYGLDGKRTGAFEDGSGPALPRVTSASELPHRGVFIDRTISIDDDSNDEEEDVMAGRVRHAKSRAEEDAESTRALELYELKSPALETASADESAAERGRPVANEGFAANGRGKRESVEHVLGLRPGSGLGARRG